MNGDIVSPLTNEKEVREEVNRRTAKAGFTTRYGEPRYGTRVMVVVARGKEKLNVWPRDEHGNLIGD